MVGLNSRKYILAVLFIAGLLIPSEVRAQLQVQPERNAIGINEDLRVEIVLEDGDSDSLDLTPLERDFEIVARARGSQVNIINGSMSKINTWSLRLVPKHSGTLTLPELCAASSCSAPVTIEVSDAPTSADDAKVILEHGSLPGRVYVGQQILYPVRLLFRTPLQQAVLDTPKPAGVDAEVIKLGEDQHRETYRGGWRYNVIERMYAIIPAQSGTLRIPPVSMEAQIEDPRTTRRRGMQGSLFDPFGSRGQRIRQRTAAAQIEVEPPARTEHPGSRHRSWISKTAGRKIRPGCAWESRQPAVSAYPLKAPVQNICLILTLRFQQRSRSTLISPNAKTFPTERTESARTCVRVPPLSRALQEPSLSPASPSTGGICAPSAGAQRILSPWRWRFCR